MAEPLAPRMTALELQIIWRMHFDQNQRPVDIAEATGRHLSSICRALKARGVKKKPGPKKKLTPIHVDKIIARARVLIAKADGAREVTVAMIKKSIRCTASPRTILRAMHDRGVWFRKLRQKPRLTQTDIKERYAFAKKYRAKTQAWWNRTLHMVIDLKSFPVFLNAKGRHHAAQRLVRGAYRLKGAGLSQGYTKTSKSAKFSSGVKNVMIAGGIGACKVRLWHEIQSKWSGLAAKHLYEGPLLKALKRAYPGRKTFTVLEDNDPTGFRSRMGIKAKENVGIRTFRIPPRSPDLNPCDYTLWKEVSVKMRERERAWGKKKKESRVEYIARLRATALKLRKAYGQAAIGGMKERCKRLFIAKGGLFEEGGSHQT